MRIFGLSIDRMSAAVLESTQRESWRRSEIESFQLGRLNEQWEHAREHVPYFRGLAGRLPVRFASIAEFKAIMPILTRSVLQSEERRLLSDSPRPGRWACTGGSTGMPVHVYRENSAERESRSLHWRMLQRYGVQPDDRVAWLWGRLASFAPGWRGRWASVRRVVGDVLSSRLRLDAYDLCQESLHSHLRRMERFQPKAIYAYTTAAYLLAQEAIVTGTRIGSLRVVALTAETVRPHQRETIEKAFGVPVVVEYGSAELGVVAFEVEGRLRVREDMNLLETVPRDDGLYDLIATRLNNASFPLFRYGTNDVTASPIDVMEDGFATIGLVEGRSADVLVNHNGDVVHPLRVSGILDLNPSVRRYQLKQTQSGSVTCHIEMKPGATLDIRDVENQFAALLGYATTISVVEHVPQSDAGKCRFIVSDFRYPGKRSPISSP